MKTITFLLALTLTGSAAFAQSLSMTSLTPTLSFPADTQSGGGVTRQTMSHGN